MKSDPSTPQTAAPPLPDNVARYERWGKWAAAIAGVGYLLLWKLGEQERFGQIGDAMGPLTGVLTALALFAAIEGVRLQREELKLQREELAASREVMREQAEAAKRSAETQERLAKAQEALARCQHESYLLAYRVHRTQLSAALAAVEEKAIVAKGSHPELLEKLWTAQRKSLGLEFQFLKDDVESSDQPRQPLDG